MLAGAFSLLAFRQVPPDGVLFFVFFFGVILVRWTFSRPVGLFLIGFVLMSTSAISQHAKKLDPQWVQQPLTFSARILDFPIHNNGTSSLIVRPLDRPGLPPRIRLSWHDSAALPNLGEVWRLSVRLKRPRGLSNPGGFDFEAWLFRERIGATGYVDNAGQNYRVKGEPVNPLTERRRSLVGRIASLLPDDEASAVLMAVSAGARHKISVQQWDLFARTGTSHLMAISGLHIGLASSFFLILTWCVFAVVTRRRNIRDSSIVVALVIAGMYTLLSGVAIPASRAFLMASVVCLAVLLRFRMPFGKVLAISCGTIVVLAPLSILSPGFKLSFAAVGIIAMLGACHLERPTISRIPALNSLFARITQLGRLQLALLFGLFPLTVLIFGRVAITAPFVNLAILPIFNIVTVPLTLLGMLLDGPFLALGDQCLLWAHQSVIVVLRILEFTDQFPFVDLQIRRLEGAAVLIAFAPALLVILPVGWPGRRIAWLAVLLVITYKPAPPPRGCLDLHVLDVGQGLAVLLRTHDKSLLYDTGPAFPRGRNMADLVVLPFLFGIGLDELDVLVISHGDQDHAGGIESVLSTIPVNRLLVGEPLQLLENSKSLDSLSTIQQTRCVAGISWRTERVRYSILHPRIRAPWTRNNSSCVLEVTVGEHRILLAGDIESPVEKLLHHRRVLRPQATLVVPHHGSKTSSTSALVNATKPNLAIVTTGYGNRWGFPKADVLARWRESGANLVDTATSGAVTQRFCEGRPSSIIRRERHQSQRFWHEDP